MKLTYYGTAAGEGWPGVFCQCDLCRQARKLGGKNIRTRSQSLINDDLLIDLPPDNQLHSLYYGLNLDKVKALLFTHSHSDHCYPEDLENLRWPYSLTRTGKLPVYGNEKVAAAILRACGSLGSDEVRYQYHTVESFVPFQTQSYTITPLAAAHDRQERCLIYHIALGEKSLLYAHDTGFLPPESLDCLQNRPGKLNLVSMDCTSQMHHDGSYHMGLADTLLFRQQLLDLGIADETTIWVVNHFSHNGGWLHEKMEEEAGKYGILVSYDGMSIEF